MVELVWVAAALVVLYFWLIGHWFARVVALIVCVPLFGFLGFAIIVGSLPDKHPDALALGWFGGVAGAIGGWVFAGGPIYYWRAKIRAIEAEQRADEARRAAEQQAREGAEQLQRQTVDRRGGYNLQQIALIKRAEEGR